MPCKLFNRLLLHHDAVGLDDLLDLSWFSLWQAGRCWEFLNRHCLFLLFFLIVKGSHSNLIILFACVYFFIASIWYKQTVLCCFLGLRRDRRLLLKVYVWLEQVDFLVAVR